MSIWRVNTPHTAKHQEALSPRYQKQGKKIGAAY